MKNLKRISLIFLILQKWVESGFAAKTKNFTENKLNQEAEWDTRLRKWLLCQRSILQNGQEAYQNWQQAKYKSSVVVVILKKTRAALILMLQKSLPLWKKVPSNKICSQAGVKSVLVNKESIKCSSKLGWRRNRCTHTITIGNLASSNQGCRQSQEPDEKSYWWRGLLLAFWWEENW